MPVTISASKGERRPYSEPAVGAGKGRRPPNTYLNGQTSWQHTRPSKSQSPRCSCQSSLWPGRCLRGPHGPGGRDMSPQAAYFILIGRPGPTISGPPPDDHLFHAGHLVQGINSGHSHDTQQGRDPCSHLAGEEVMTTSAEMMVARPWAQCSGLHT